MSNKTEDEEVNLHLTIDAKVWAKEFMRLYDNNKLRPINVPDWVDEALMIGWFANAIMVGYDKGKAQSHLGGKNE